MENLTNTIQKENYEILKVFHDICEKEDLKYILDFGTLLGSVRHEGFIPWDDDLDVAMPREDYEKFLKVASKYLPLNMTIQNSQTEKNYFMPFTKIRKTDVNLQEDELNMYKVSKGVWLDIFVYDYTSTNEDEEVEKLLKLNKARNYYAYSFPVLYEKDKKIKNWPKTIIKIVMLKLLKRAQEKEHSYILKHIHNKCTNFEDIIKETPVHISSEKMRCYQFKNNIKELNTENILFIDSFNKRILAPFENGMFYIPENFHQVLEYRYGNYMELPPLNERASTHRWVKTSD